MKDNVPLVEIAIRSAIEEYPQYVKKYKEGKYLLIDIIVYKAFHTLRGQVDYSHIKSLISSIIEE